MSEIINKAVAHGAKVEQGAGGVWYASAYRRGRKLPLVTLVGSSQEEVCEMYLHYFRNIKRRDHADDK